MLQGEVSLFGVDRRDFCGTKPVAQKDLLGKFSRDGDRVVRAEPVDDNNLIRPAHALQTIPHAGGLDHKSERRQKRAYREYIRGAEELSISVFRGKGLRVNCEDGIPCQTGLLETPSRCPHARA